MKPNLTSQLLFFFILSFFIGQLKAQSPPVAICNSIFASANNSCEAVVNTIDFDNGSFDPDGGPLNFSATPPGPYGLGTTMVVLTVTDLDGFSTTCNPSILVTDTTPPTLSCQGLLLPLEPNGTALLTPGNLITSTSENCNSTSFVLSQSLFTCADLGNHQIVLTATDASGNSTSCSVPVTILDLNAICPPIMNCQNLVRSADINCQGTAKPPLFDNGSYDPNGNPLTFAASPTGPYPLGITTVVITATDEDGLSSTCSATINVIDDTPPALICKDAVKQLDSNGDAVIGSPDVLVSTPDNCSLPSLNIGQTNFSCADAGQTIPVVLTATDATGNIATCVSNVSIEDKEPPTCIAQDFTYLLNSIGEAYPFSTDINNGSFDNCGVFSSNIDLGLMTCTNIGANIVTLTVVDNSGNFAQCTAVITIEDKEPPTAICQDVTIPLSANGNITITAADINNGSFDNCSISAMSILPNNFNCSNLGTNTVILTVSDNSGNTATCSSVVTITDTTPPIITCQNTTVQLDANGMAMVTSQQVIQPNASSSDVFINSGQSLGSFSTSDVKMADLNGDGFEDAFVTNGSNQANKVYLNDGTGNFIDTGVSLGTGVSTEVALKDLNNDGDIDAFVSNSAGRNKVFFNDGAGNFTDSGQNLGYTTNNSLSVVLGDIDGDNDYDACLCNYNQYCQVFKNNGSGFFSLYQNFGGNSFGNGIDLADLDNDGDLDVFVANGFNFGNWVYLNNGSGNFSNTGQSFGTSNASDVKLIDVNNDNYPDAFITYTNAPNKIWLNDGTSQFTDSGQSLSNAQSGNVSFADFNSDGILDAWVGNTNSPNKIYLNDAAGIFTDSGVNISGFTGDCRPSDVDGDGDFDAFVMKSGPNQVWLNQLPSDNCSAINYTLTPDTFTCADAGQTISVLVTATDVSGNSATCTSDITVLDTNNPCAQDPIAICQNLTLPANGHCEAIVTASDFDNGSNDPDGDPLSYTVSPFGPYSIGITNVVLTVTDLSGASATCSATITVNDITPPTLTCQNTTVQLDANGMAMVTENDVLAPNSTVWQFTSNGQALGGNGHSARVALADFDGDGDDDAYVAHLSNQPNKVWMNDGTGNFTDSGQSLGAGESQGVAADDLDGDGDIDVFVANSSNEQNVVYLNDGTGNFTATGQSFIVTSSQDIELGDIDGDGDIDAIAISFYSSRVYFNDGDASFTASTHPFLPNYAYGADLKDLDGDNDLDLFIAFRIGQDLVWLNDGNGVFTDSGQLLGVNANSETCALIDIDGDNDMDAYIGNSNSPDELWLNNGSGIFANSGQTLGTTLSRTIHFGDADGDNDPDAFISHQGGNEIWVNDGSGTFTNSGLSIGTYNTWGIDIADLDGDGDLDIFGANVGNPDRIWLNNTVTTFSNIDNCGTPTYTISPNSFTCADVGQIIPVLVTATDASGNSSTCSSNVTITDPNLNCLLALNVKVMMGGPYSQANNMMGDELRTNGYIPMAQPYSIAPFNYAGAEVTTPTVLALTGNDAVVDWVLIELRDKNNSATIVAQRAGLLQRDGDVVDENGMPLLISNLTPDDYFVSVRHRNHLGVMTLNAITLSYTPVLVDFNSTTIYGTNAMKTINGTNVLWPGDSNYDGVIDAGDRSLAWNNRNQSGYLVYDVTLDGNVDSGDRSTMWNNRNKTAQLP